MSKNLDLVYNAIMKFTEGNFRNRVFIAPDIPAKKLVNAQSKYITRDEPIVVLIDDTIFGSAKDGLAISENYVYAKGTLGDIKSVKISSIRSVSSQSNKLGSLDIYFGGNLFVTLSTIDKEDHDFVIGILKAAYAASKSVENSAPAKVKKPSKPVAAEPKPKNSNLGKETVACSECSANLPAGAKFCLECGTKVLPKGVCLECNAKLPEKAKFCSECGTPAGKVPAKPVQPKVDTQAFTASIGITAASVDGGRQGAIDSSEGMVSEEIVDWHQAADRAFNFFFNAIRKGEDTDTAAEWFRGEIADQTEAAGIVYDCGWEQEITPFQLQIISNTVANRLKGLNDEQGYQVSSDFYHGFIASLSNIIYNRSQEGNGDFEDLQEYWDQKIGNELPEECGTRLPNSNDNNEGTWINSALQRLAEKTEINITASGRLASYFRDCDNLYPSISIEHGPGNLLKVSVVVETDGKADDLEEVEEAIGDYVFDMFLTAGLLEIFGEDGYEALEFDNQFRVKPISSASHISDSHEPIDIAQYNNNVNVQKFLFKYKEFGRPAGQLDEELILLGFGTKGFSITQENYDGVSQEDEWFGDLLCDTILPLKMDVGQIKVLGPCEVRCVFVHQISQRNEDDVLEVVNFYIVEFQCDTILLAIYGWYDEQEFSSEYYKIISSEGVHRTSCTGYLSEMTEDLQAIEKES